VENATDLGRIPIDDEPVEVHDRNNYLGLVDRLVFYQKMMFSPMNIVLGLVALVERPSR
jgi:hypothetical protein